LKFIETWLRASPKPTAESGVSDVERYRTTPKATIDKLEEQHVAGVASFSLLI
jgi:hypothetical protein